jgi:hypothetical protein
MMGVPALIGRAANNPMPLIADFRFCHSCFRRFSLIASLIFIDSPKTYSLASFVLDSHSQVDTFM